MRRVVVIVLMRAGVLSGLACRTNAEENPERGHDRESISGVTIIPLRQEIRTIRRHA